MLCQKIPGVWLRRGVCTVNEKPMLCPLPDEKREFRKPTDVPIKDPNLFWVETEDCTKRHKTWREMEEEFTCAVMARFTVKVAPERKFFNIESGDLYICRRGCMQPCIPPPCYDPEYPSVLESALYRLMRLTSLAVFLGLLYATYGLHVWGPTRPTLDTLLGSESDNKIDQMSEVGNVATKSWNYVVGIAFNTIRYLFPTKNDKEEFDLSAFVYSLQEDMKERKELEKEALIKEDPNVYEEWELVYNYVPEPPKLTAETVDDADWLWMDHSDPNFVKKPKVIMPYENSAKAMKTGRVKPGVTLASIYTDLCSTWTVEKGSDDDDETSPCSDDSPQAKVCKSKKERKQKVRINPKKDCVTCPTESKAE